MSLPRRYDSSVPRSRAALLPQAVADARQLRARVIEHLAGPVDLRRGPRRSRLLNDAAPLGDRRQPRDSARDPADGGARQLRANRGTSRAPAAERLERAALRPPSSASSSSRSSGARSGKTRLVLRGTAPSRSSPASSLAARGAGRCRGRSAARRAAPMRRQRKAAHGVDDAIEFEGPEGTRVHNRVDANARVVGDVATEGPLPTGPGPAE